MFETLPKLNGTAVVEFTIDGESVLIEINGNDAPITAGNFVDLVDRGTYDGVAFHRIVDNFVTQGGDPQSLDPNFPIEGLGGGGFINPETGERRTIPLEIKLEGDEEPTYNVELGRLAGVEPPPDVVLEHDRGAIAMARSTPPDSASSQFYIVTGEAGFLDGDYAAFGNVTEGLDIIDSIEPGDRIEDAEVIEGLDNLEPGEPDTTISLYRFRNTSFDTGTYLFAGEGERNGIITNSDLNSNFALEGEGNIAFEASIRSGDDLLPFYRIRSLDVEGTYSFVSTEEYEAIFADDSDQRDKWVQEGLDADNNDLPEFYLYGAGAGEGTEFHRFQNNENGTFLFAGPDETAAINSDPNLSGAFTDQGVAFESLI